MSKNYNYRNYRQMAKPVDEAIPVESVEEVKEVIAEAAANLEVDVDECAACDEVPEITGDGNAPLVGVVKGCSRLNIRSGAGKDFSIVTVVEAGTELMIDYPIDVNSEWIKIYTGAGIEGYCMKEFVTVNK